MDDFFALLGEERRPGLDAEALKAKYYRLTAERHPDVAGGDGAAFAADQPGLPGARGTGPAVAAFAGTGNRRAIRAAARGAGNRAAGFFEPVGLARQRAEAFLRKRAAAASPLAQALLAAEQYEVQEDLGAVIEDLDAAREKVLAEVSAADARWREDRAAAVAKLPEMLAIAELPGQMARGPAGGFVPLCGAVRE